MGLEEVPYRVRNYFLTPCEKWSLGRRPFKLVTQLIKIVIITAQIYRFGSITQGKKPLKFFKIQILTNFRHCGISK